MSMTTRKPRRTTLRWITAVTALAMALAACDGATQAPESEQPAADGEYAGVDDQPNDAAAMFDSPEDGATVTSPFTVDLSVENITLMPAGIPVAGEGHLHVMTGECFATGDVIPGPSDEDEAEGRFHLGDGSDSRQIELEPGTHDLCVQLADGIHTAFGETQTITVTVE